MTTSTRRGRMLLTLASPLAPFLGRALLTTYALPFEVVSILLLAGMVGAIVLARKE